MGKHESKNKMRSAAKVKVKFIIGEEEADDGGGPRNEMLGIAIRQAYQPNLFIETEDAYVPSCGSTSIVQLGPAAILGGDQCFTHESWKATAPICSTLKAFISLVT
ncbi:Hypp6632 [Branchiostoma lanceolatum]|uniref:Hypp6632 protein n=1 Tax=Branchiostoma lanceolatum TaxID=7740 RepID=A0A8J9YV98_BRALA|nr:Hypp6632 [Branchiostoma lanceolatum]